MLELDSALDIVRIPIHATSQLVDGGLPRWRACGTQLLNQGAALYDQLRCKLDDSLTLIDRDRFAGFESGLCIHHQSRQGSSSPAKAANKSKDKPHKDNRKDAPKPQTGGPSTSFITSSYIAKVDLYANSKLPLKLPSYRLTTSNYPILRLAAEYSERVYEKARGAEKHSLVDADFRTGTKAMYIKSVPMDKMRTIVFAIRGTATFMDWAVNLNTAPTAPLGFLDDNRNLCHAGFLAVARNMVAPVAARLRQLLEENPRRSAYSLLITGHSAGGAVASLLYMHMLATSEGTTSELNSLTARFKRVHCVTFGAPPVSLFPLATPRRYDLRKSLFCAFVNEGDPVARADKAYVKSLLELFAAPAPAAGERKSKATQDLAEQKSKSMSTLTTFKIPRKSDSALDSTHDLPEKNKSMSTLRTLKIPRKSDPALPSPPPPKPKTAAATASAAPVWQVPHNTLSNAGKLIVLRSHDRHAVVHHVAKTLEERLREDVVAQVASDEKIRGLIWGDPVCHVMRLYAARIDALAGDVANFGSWMRRGQ